MHDNTYDVQMNFCRRCGSKLTHARASEYVCQQGHHLFLNASPAIGVMLVNGKNEVLMAVRGIEPGKGALDIPGGFCDGPETLGDAIVRELQEEVGLSPDDYSQPEFILETVDSYEFGGEKLPVLGVIYRATLNPQAQPQPDDDVAEVRFVPIQDIDLQQVFFPGVRRGLQWLQQNS